jgi:type IV secretion system protein VirD4
MGGGRGRTIFSEEIPILRPEEIRQLPDKQALVVAENARPIIARLHRCIEGRDGQRLLAQQRALRDKLADSRDSVGDIETRTAAALVEAQRHGW